MEAAKLGTDKPLCMPWMQATYIMVADKRALPFLPAGADINALTYDQLAQWGRNLARPGGGGGTAGQRRRWTGSSRAISTLPIPVAW